MAALSATAKRTFAGWLGAMVLFVANAICLSRLFSAEILGGEDANAPLIALTRWFMGGLRFDGWLPFWYGGVPVGRLGSLGMPWVASILGTRFGWTPQHAFHFLAAIVCCLIPVVLFALLAQVRTWMFALLAAGLLSLLSVPFALLKDGNAPHLLGLLLVLVLLWMARAALRRRVWAIPLASLTFAGLLLTDFLGVVTLAVLLLAICLSRPIWSFRQVTIAAGIGLLGGLLAYPRLDTGALLLNRTNLLVAGNWLPHRSFYGFLFLISGILILHFPFARYPVSTLLRVLAYSCLMFGAIFGCSLVPHAAAFALDFNVAACACIAYGLHALYGVSNPRRRLVAALIVICLAAGQFYALRSQAKALFRTTDVTGTPEYRTGQWLRQNSGGGRVFALGGTGAWLNVFSDVPQMTGCCESFAPAQVYGAASWAIQTGQNAGPNEVSNSLKWLKTFGVSYVVVDGSYSRRNKFDGVLPLVFQDRDVSVYSLPIATHSLAHAVAAEDIAQYVPEDGADLVPVDRYAHAIDATDQVQTQFRWLDGTHARIDATLAPGQQISVQMNDDPGWHARVNGKPARVFADALGLLATDAPCTGRCTVDLEWAPAAWPLFSRVGYAIPLLCLLGAVMYGPRHSNAVPTLSARRRWLAPASIATLGILFFVLLIRTAWVAEDAYIPLRVTDNILAGYGPRWNVDERVQTYTDPLFSAIVTCATWLMKDVYTASIVVSLGFTAAALFFLLRGATVTGFVIAGAALFCSKGFVDYSVSGLENPATHCLLAAYIFFYFRRRDPLVLSLCAALAALNREDSILLLLPSLVWVYWSQGVRVWKRAVAGWSPFLAWLVFATFYYGFPFPNTAYAKLPTGIPMADVFQQGLLYFVNAWHWDTATVVVIVAGFGVAAAAGEWTIAAGLALNLLYVTTIGGDYMTGRFLTAAFVVSVAIVAGKWRWKPAPTIALATVIVAAGVTIPSPTITSARATFGEPWPIDPATNISDERAYWYPCAGLLRRGNPAQPWPRHLVRPDQAYWWSCVGPPVAGSAASLWPDAFLARVGNSWRQSGARATIIGNIGMAGFFAGPGVHVIDDMALGDPLLARLPAIRYKVWRPGHYRRLVPAGYLETVKSGTNQLTDPDLHEYFNNLHVITSGKLWDANRLREIVLFNLGSYEYLVDRYNRRSQVK